MGLDAQTYKYLWLGELSDPIKSDGGLIVSNKSNPAMIPKRPVQPVLGISIHTALEPWSEPVRREKKEYSTNGREVRPIGDNRC